MGSILSRTEQTERGLVGYVTGSNQRVLLHNPRADATDAKIDAGIGSMHLGLIENVNRRRVYKSPDNFYFLFGRTVTRTIGNPIQHVYGYCPFVVFEGVPISEIEHDRSCKPEVAVVG